MSGSYDSISLTVSAAALLALSSFHAVASASCRTGAVVVLGGWTSGEGGGVHWARSTSRAEVRRRPARRLAEKPSGDRRRSRCGGRKRYDDIYKATKQNLPARTNSFTKLYSTRRQTLRVIPVPHTHNTALRQRRGCRGGATAQSGSRKRSACVRERPRGPPRSRSRSRRNLAPFLLTTCV